jgi:hypothetical protein
VARDFVSLVRRNTIMSTETVTQNATTDTSTGTEPKSLAEWLTTLRPSQAPECVRQSLWDFEEGARRSYGYTPLLTDLQRWLKDISCEDLPGRVRHEMYELQAFLRGHETRYGKAYDIPAYVHPNTGALKLFDIENPTLEFFGD